MRSKRMNTSISIACFYAHS